MELESALSPRNSPNSADRAPLNRMEQWPNDDLLMQAHAREYLKAEFPEAYEVLDWPELRRTFEEIDKKAIKARKRRQRIGFTAVGVAGLGAFLSAALPLVELAGGEVMRSAFFAAVALSAAGLVFSLFFVTIDRAKSQWLEQRLLTERLRQFYFQFMIFNAGLAIRAMRDPTALEEWRREQAEAVQFFLAWAKRPMRAELAAVIDDVNDKHAWMRAKWRRRPEIPLPSNELDTYFGILRRQRIGIQLHYVREKLQPGFGSPESRLNLSQVVGYTCASLTFAATAVAAALLLQGSTTAALEFRILTSIAALCGAVGVVCKVLAEGLQLKMDVERYRWYRAAVADIDAEFHDNDVSRRFALLRKIEYVAYREMREFLKIHEESKFRLT